MSQFFTQHPELPFAQPHSFSLPPSLESNLNCLSQLITLANFNEYFTASSSQPPQISLQELYNALAPPKHPYSYYYQCDPHSLITSVYYRSLITAHKLENNPEVCTFYREITTAHASEIIHQQFMLSQQIEYDQNFPYVPPHTVIPLTFDTFDSAFNQSGTTLVEWTESPHFLQFCMTHNVDLNSILPWCPMWKDIFNKLLVSENNSFTKHHILKKNTIITWPLFLNGIANTFPKRYFKWKDHSLLKEHTNMEKRANVTVNCLLHLAKQYAISNDTLRQRFSEIGVFMEWPCTRGTLWHMVSHIFFSVHVPLFKQIKRDYIKSCRPFVAYYNRLAAMRYYKKSLKQMLNHEFNSEDWQNAQPNFLRQYSCLQCQKLLPSLTQLRMRLCPSCERITCKSCFHLVFEPTFKDICSTCTNMLD